MSNKLKNTRIITMKEDYKTKGVLNPDGKTFKAEPRVVLAKGSTHAIHHVTAAKLKDRGAKFDSREVNIEKEREAARKRHQANEKKRLSALWN